MNSIIKVALLSTAMGFSASANATIIDFIHMADHTPGERGLSTLSVAGGLLDITAHASNDDDLVQYAYLDAGNAGLGACKDINSSLQCTPSSDDNVTTDEWLTLTAVSDLVISNLWFNNNHDGGFNNDSKINIGLDPWLVNDLDTGAYGYLDDANYMMDINLATGDSIKISYNNAQFYMSAMEVEAVPEPSILALFGLGLIGLGFARKRHNKA